MRRPWRELLRGWPVIACCYAAALLATNIWLESSSPRTERRVLYDVSTNLRHLGHDPWQVLGSSAFFTSGGLVFAVAGALLLVGLLERVAGWRMTVVVAVTAHLIGTLVSESVVAIRIAAHDASATARDVLDVGPSYVIVGCAAAVGAWPGVDRRIRAVALIAVTPLFIFTAWRLPAGRIDAIGHLTAAFVGVTWAWWKRRDPMLGEEARPA